MGSHHQLRSRRVTGIKAEKRGNSRGGRRPQRRLKGKQREV